MKLLRLDSGLREHGMGGVWGTILGCCARTSRRLGVVICEWKISNWGDFSNTDFNVEASRCDLR